LIIYFTGNANYDYQGNLFLLKELTPHVYPCPTFFGIIVVFHGLWLKEIVSVYSHPFYPLLRRGLVAFSFLSCLLFCISRCLQIYYFANSSALVLGLDQGLVIAINQHQFLVSQAFLLQSLFLKTYRYIKRQIYKMLSYHFQECRPLKRLGEPKAK
jgi:hypothetical protein